MLSLKPDKGHLKTTAGVVETRLGEVPVGATIIVNPGERVPLDGVILKGESTVDTSTLTGEAEPLYVNPGPADTIAWDMNDGTKSQGMAMVVTLKNGEAAYRLYRAKALSVAEKAEATRIDVARAATPSAPVAP